MELLRRVPEGPDSALARRGLGLSLGSVYVGSYGWLALSLSELGEFVVILAKGS